jgi:pyruvate formate lyase activating enzyme
LTRQLISDILEIVKRKKSSVASPRKAPRNSGFIFDIKRFAVHDGPGIRTTVFLKGCPLHCLWCHNPEGIASGPELMVRSSRCSRCYSCIEVCPPNAIAKGPANGPVVVDRSKCDLCGKCVEACMYEALQLVGRETTVAEVVAEVEKDRIFYDQSGGGATISGGEPLSQLRFTARILAELRHRRIHAALDTSGFAPWDTLWSAARLADLVLFDLKLIDSEAHAARTGVPNDAILENLSRLARSGRPVVVRIPLAAGVNDGRDNIRRTIEFLKPLPGVERVDLLRYHQGGREKYRNLGRSGEFEIYEPPLPARMEEIRRAFSDGGFAVTSGG